MIKIKISWVIVSEWFLFCERSLVSYDSRVKNTWIARVTVSWITRDSWYRDNAWLYVIFCNWVSWSWMKTRFRNHALRDHDKISSLSYNFTKIILKFSLINNLENFDTITLHKLFLLFYRIVLILAHFMEQHISYKYM